MANNLPIPPRDPKSKPNPEFVQDLKAGLPKLWMARSKYEGTKQKFICFTLKNWLLRKEIGDRLECGYAITYSTWVKNELNVDVISDRKLQAARKAWMLDLIEEFS
jgi:hypothetical protein